MTDNKFGEHPCFYAGARMRTARVHLPVAEKCNIQCNFCNRRTDCINESRPGVTSAVLSPQAALKYLDDIVSKLKNTTPVTVTGIAGPGDPFACPEETLETLRLVHSSYPDMILCLATNGLNLAPYTSELAGLVVSHVTVTLNTVNPETGAKIYAWVRKQPKVYRGTDGANVLLEAQIEGIKALVSKYITVKINTVVIPGINDNEIAETAQFAASLGASVQNCIPLLHVEDTAFETILPPSKTIMDKVRREAGAYLPQLNHYGRCRADAAGLIGEQTSETALSVPFPALSQTRPFIAAASMEGLFVNCHLGQANALWVFAVEDGKLVLKEQRGTPAPGGGDRRWREFADIFSDCFAILALHCGENPKRVLSLCGIEVFPCEGLIADAAAYILKGKKPFAPRTGGGFCDNGGGCCE